MNAGLAPESLAVKAPPDPPMDSIMATAPKLSSTSQTIRVSPPWPNGSASALQAVDSGCGVGANAAS